MPKAPVREERIAPPARIDVSARPASSRKHGLRGKARRGDGPLPAEAGIDYVGMWEGGKKQH